MAAQAQYSAIVVGGGHNGLVAANYLARQGNSVLVLERRDFVGGACITEELFPGFRVSSCAYICHLLHAKVIDDLELRRHGLEIYEMDPVSFHPLPGGEHVLRWHDDERTAENIARISPADGASYHDWTAFWRQAGGIIQRYFLTDPPTLAEVAADVRGTPDEAIFERMLTGNMKDLVEEHFESPLVRACFIDAQDAGDVRAPGSIMAVGYIRSDILTPDENFGIPKGGMGAITQAMARSAQSQGVEIRLNAEVHRILMQNGRVIGVQMADGERIHADAVLSNADPKRTFLSLIGADDVPPPLLNDIRRAKTEASYLKFHCAMSDLPDFSAYLGENYDPKALAYIRVCPSVEYFERNWDDVKRGRPSSSPVMYIQIPTVYDDTLTPPGKHVMSVWSMYAPVRLREGTWQDARHVVGEHLIDTIARYAPNFRDVLLDWELFTPAELEERVGLTDGNIRHLDITSQQMFAMRGSRSISGYRTPIEGLYICGAGAHPGGEVTGAPGHNAAHILLRDWEQAV
ncbi:MAG: NAD(P)/FAD-dependent oxidoreductase [Chloroflexi bacterium]|nr:NAD(P)/FAD-dependent oxidoreductase [Chloroflexota bacterium]